MVREIDCFMDMWGGCALAALASEELASTRWRIPRSHPAPELPVLSNQAHARGPLHVMDPLRAGGAALLPDVGGHLLDDLAALVGDIHSARLDVEDNVGHRAQHALAGGPTGIAGHANLSNRGGVPVRSPNVQ